MPPCAGCGRDSLLKEHLWATQCLQAPLLHSGGALPSPLALTSHIGDTGWFFEPFLLKPVTEPFPYSSVGSIVAELKGTPVIRVALISAAHSTGQLHLFSGPRTGQGPSSR